MPANQNLSLSPITGQMVHLPQAISAPPAKRDKEKSTSTSRPHDQYSPMWPPPPLYYPFLQPPTAFSPATHIFNNHPFLHPPTTFSPVTHIFNNHTYNINKYHSSKVSCSHHSSHHHSSHAQLPEIPTSTRNSRPSHPRHANRPIEPSTHAIHRPPHATKAKGVYFTESVSARDKERKKYEDPHRTKHASKSGKKPEAVRIERLCCENCNGGSQRWLESGSGRGVKLCEECHRARDRRRRW